MQGLMMSQPLLVKSILEHAERVNPDVELVSVTADNPRHRYTLRESFERVRRLANVIDGWGLAQGDRVATLAWNDYRHFESYYGICASGRVVHTINPRLFPAQIEYIINHADDQWVLASPDFLPLLEHVAPNCPGVKGWVILTDEAHMPQTNLQNIHCYETLLSGASADYTFPQIDENAACALCYTSGTTGNPKGVLYSHRSTILHAYAAAMPDYVGLSCRDTVLSIVPMFHVNAWGIPYACPMVGAKLVFPGSKMGDPATLTELINDEQVTIAAGVPTVWLGLLAHLRGSGETIDSLHHIIVGGSACPSTIVDGMEALGVETRVAWGMTEMSPLGTLNVFKRELDNLPADEKAAMRLKAGRPVFGVEMKIVGEDGEELPWDGKTFGSLKVRGPWVCSGYYKQDDSDAHAEPGWFETGDVATIDQHAYMGITDRTKDVIKSGGEWISSIEVENAAMVHPGVAEAAVIGRPHPKWGERPLLVAVRSEEGAALTADELLGSLKGEVAKWWIPDAVEFIDEMPHGATGKVNKLELRNMFESFGFSE